MPHYFPRIAGALEPYAAEFEADFVCSLCRVFGDNVQCESCDANVCETCAARCCVKLPPPTCTTCRKPGRGAWSCVACATHVCAYCAPEDVRPASFWSRDLCRACVRARRGPEELKKLVPLLAKLPVNARPVLAAAVL